MPKPRFQMWGMVGLLMLVTIALYWQVLGHDFVNLDDPEYVTANAHVQGGLSLENVRWACLNTVCCNWHPLTVWSHMLDYQLFGARPWGHHLTSVLLHAFNAALVFALLQLLTRATWRSLVVAALFAVHPLRVESVAWVAERKDVLSTCFGLLALIAYARYAQGAVVSNQWPVISGQWSVGRGQSSGVPATRHGPRTTVHRPLITDHRILFYFLSLFFFACGLMSKPMLVTWPFVMLLLDYWPLKRMQNVECRMQTAGPSGTLHAPRSTLHASPPTAQSPIANRQSQVLLPLLLEKLPFFALAALGSITTLVVQRHAMTAVETLPWAVRVGNALVSYGRYLGKLFWPVDLAVFYPHPGHWPLGIVMLAGGVILGLSTLFWKQRRQYPYLLVGWLWFIGTLVPVIGLVQVGAQAMADRYTYLPLLGVLLLAVWSVDELVQGKAEVRGQKSEAGDTLHAPRSTLDAPGPTVQSPIANRQSQILLRLVGGAAMILCLALTHRQLAYWKGSETLFRHALAVTSDNWLAHINLGIALHRQGRLDEALSHFQEAARLKPNHADACSNLGGALNDKGQTDEAIRQFEKALQLRPDHPDAHYNLGNALAKQGHTDEAIRHYQEALRVKPDNANVHNNLGLALARQGRTDEAIAQFREAFRLDPNHADAHVNLGNAFAGKGRLDEAISQFEEAIRRKPDYAQAHYNLGVVLLTKGQGNEAIGQLQEAIRLKPAYPEALGLLAGALDSQGKHAEAIRCYQTSLEILPDQAGVLNNLAWLRATCSDAALRNGREAVRQATRACELTRYTQPLLIGTLAAAQAEAGDFQAAIASGERAAALADAAHLPQVATRNRELVELYRQNQPYHEKRESTADAHR